MTGPSPRRRHNSVRRRIAVATWRPSKDSRIYTRSTVDAGPVLAYCKDKRRTGVRVTVTHVVGAALARAIRAEPDVMARVVLGRIVPYPTCDISFAVDIDGGGDLAPFKVRCADQKTPAEIAGELTAGAARLRRGADPHYSRSSAIVRRLPAPTLRPLVNLMSLFAGGLGVGVFGQPGFPLGAAFVSNLGTLGLEEGYLTPVPFARVPLYVGIGAIRETPAVVAGEVVVRPQLVLAATGDHRVIDGAQAGRVNALLRQLLAEPNRLDRPWPA